MINNINFFEITNNFSKIINIPSIEILKSNLDFTPKYTIAIPTFKRVKLLQETIECAINQEGFNDYDIIVVDNDPDRDCETERFLKKINNKKISYYKNSKNIGMTGNWNRLFELAVGDYLIMLHDDDLLYPNYLSTINKLQIKFNFAFDAIYPKYNYYDNNILSEPPIQNINKYLEYIKLTTKDFALSNIIGAPVGVCFNRNKVIEIGGFDESYYPSLDYAFYVKFSFFFKSIKLWNNEISIYRIHENESQNSNTLLGFIEKDKIIRREIILNNYKKWVLELFNYYYEYSNLIYIKKSANLYRIEDVNLLNIGCKFIFFKKVYFSILDRIWALKLKFKKNKINIE